MSDDPRGQIVGMVGMFLFWGAVVAMVWLALLALGKLAWVAVMMLGVTR